MPAMVGTAGAAIAAPGLVTTPLGGALGYGIGKTLAGMAGPDTSAYLAYMKAHPTSLPQAVPSQPTQDFIAGSDARISAGVAQGRAPYRPAGARTDSEVADVFKNARASATSVPQQGAAAPQDAYMQQIQYLASLGPAGQAVAAGMVHPYQLQTERQHYGAIDPATAAHYTAMANHYNQITPATIDQMRGMGSYHKSLADARTAQTRNAPAMAALRSTSDPAPKPASDT